MNQNRRNPYGQGRWFIRWTPAPGLGGYVTRRSPNRKPYVQHPADPDVKTWVSRANAERYLSRKDPMWVTHCVIIEAPTFWLQRDAQTNVEWDELATFFGLTSGCALREQVCLADQLLAELIAERAETHAYSEEE